MGGGMGGGMGGLDALSALGGLGGLAGLGGGKNNKLDLGAMQNAMEQNMKSLEKREKMKQRINEKADKRRIELQAENERLQNIPQTLPLTEKELEHPHGDGQWRRIKQKSGGGPEIYTDADRAAV